MNVGEKIISVAFLELTRRLPNKRQAGEKKIYRTAFKEMTKTMKRLPFLLMSGVVSGVVFFYSALGLSRRDTSCQEQDLQDKRSDGGRLILSGL